jgi:hypothetical protein
MDHDECRQLIEHQIGRWASRPILRFFDKIVLRRLDLDGHPTETLETFRLHDPVDYEVAILENCEQLLSEARVFGIVEAAQRDADARKAGLQRYALYPFYSDGTHGRRKNFRAVPEEVGP